MPLTIYLDVLGKDQQNLIPVKVNFTKKNYLAVISLLDPRNKQRETNDLVIVVPTASESHAPAAKKVKEASLFISGIVSLNTDLAHEKNTIPLTNEAGFG